MRDQGYKDAAFHPSSQLPPSLALFLSPGNETGRLFRLPAKKVNEDGGGKGGWLTSKGVSNEVGPFLNFPSTIFFSANWVDG